MSFDIEARLISKVIRSKDVMPVLEYGLQPDWFYDDDSRIVWKFILDHVGKYQEVPSPQIVKENFPTYKLFEVDDNVEYMLDNLVDRRKRQKIIEVVQDAAEEISQGNHVKAIDLVSRGIAALTDEGVSKTSDINLSKDATVRYDEYIELKNRPNGLLGIPTGFNTIDLATAGLQPGQLITIIAPPKTGKSILSLQVAVNLHEDGYVPMYQSFEMFNSEQKNRHDAMRAGISHGRLIRGALKVDEEVRYKKALERMEQMHNFYLTDSPSASTVSGLYAKIEKLQPDIVFVDGVYLMVDEISGERNTPLALTNITRSLKKLAQQIQKPVIITTQVLNWKVRGGKVTASAIGYSSSFEQDSDVILSLERQDAEDDTSRILRIASSRNCGPAEVDLLWDWENGKFQEYATP